MQLVHYAGSVPNFGDDLNALVWPALAPHLFVPDGDDRGFVGIGTILGMPGVGPRRLEVFSTGAGYDPLDRWADREVTFHCVRGPVTTHALGLDPSLAATDGAILCPHVPGLPPARVSGNAVSVIPHFQTIAFPGWAQACAMAGLQLVDPRATPQEVLGAISSSQLVITESLHGAILADTYGVPWVAFAASGNFCVPKWVDWAASLGLEPEVTMVPPPTPDVLEKYGKRAEPFGTTARFPLEQAQAEMQQRVHGGGGSAPRWRSMAAALVKRSGLHQWIKGYGQLDAARTAEALSALAQREGQLSNPARRQELTDRMLSLLASMR
ncbi:MAG TPA: polysaccharide pyruvyl transferase family protein [Novosphingobium sp.]|nr:polysaccharide pyruvyl transferase family protein [Novosphingobium sp.]